MSWQETPSANLSSDGRLRLTHGPIDLIVTAEGPQDAVRAAYIRARDAFGPVLETLVTELPRLRMRTGPDLTGPVASRMQIATDRFAPAFVTPMAAVAGSVADHILAAILTPGHGLDRTHVNNGGDIALWTGTTPLHLAICEDPVTGTAGARASIGPGDMVGGVATSGWRGRSHSLGIADAVTVLAQNAAMADAAATLIANAVNLPGHRGISRTPACDLAPDSDLGRRLVTTDVALLSERDAARALDAALMIAQHYLDRGLITAACLACQGQRRAIGTAVTETGKTLTHA